MRIIGIYSITNIVNGKRIIGQSDHIYRRWKSHISYLRRNAHPNPILQRSWNKHGENNFKLDILFLCSIQDLNSAEIKFIDVCRTENREFGYNLIPGGTKPPPKTEEQKKKMSESMKGEKNWNFGRDFSSEHRKRIGDAQRGDKSSWFGKKMSETTKKKIGDAHRGDKNWNFGKHHSEEWKNHMSLCFMGEKNHMYGKKVSEEVKLKRKETLKNMSPERKEEIRKKLSDSHKGHKHSEETKRKMSGTKKGKDMSYARSFKKTNLKP